MKNTYPKTIIILGRSGSGKDTQVRLLVKKLGFDIFTTGDNLRKLGRESNILGKRLSGEIRKGNLAPTWLVSYLWIKKLVGLKPHMGIIFNGSPRMPDEATLIDEVLSWLGRGDPFVVLIEVSEKEAMLRLIRRRICSKCGMIVPYVGEFKSWKNCQKCGGKFKVRPDDKPAAIRTRFSWFKKEVGPVIRHYKRKKLLKVVNGEQDIEGVFKDILNALE